MPKSSAGPHSNNGFSIGADNFSDTSSVKSFAPSSPLGQFCTDNSEQSPLIISGHGSSTLSQTMGPHQIVDVYGTTESGHWTQASRFGRYEADCVGYDNHLGKAHVPCLPMNVYVALKQITDKSILLPNVSYTKIDEFRALIELEVSDPDIPQLGVILSLMLEARRLSLEEDSESNKKKNNTSSMSFNCPTHQHHSQAAMRRNMISAPHNLSHVNNHVTNQTTQKKPELTTSTSLAQIINTVLRNPVRVEAHPLGPGYDDAQEVSMVVTGSIETITVCRLIIIRFADAASMVNIFPGIKKVREIFFIIGPVLEPQIYLDMGRALASVASNPTATKTFEELKSQESITKAVDRFLFHTAVIAPGRIENKNLVSAELIANVVNMEYDRKEKAAAADAVFPKDVDIERNCTEKEEKDDGSWLFRGVRADLRNRLRHYRSDIVDGLRFAMLPVILYMFCVTVVPTLTFGAIMSIGTGGLLAVKESLMSQALSGLIWTIFSCQPLLVVSPTGPILVFEKALFRFCEGYGLDFMEVRFYIGFFVFILSIIGSGTNCAQLIRHLTLYTEDIFCGLISLIFFFESGSFILHQLELNPVYNLEYYVKNAKNCTDLSSDDCHLARPNAFLIQLSMAVVSIALFHYIRKIGKSKLFSSVFRSLSGNFGGIFAVVVSSVFYQLFMKDIKISMVDIPATFGQNRLGYGYFVVPQTIPSIMTIGIAAFASFLLYILLFVETEIPEQMVLRESRRLKKGGGYHWDMIIVGFCTQVSSIIGLPWMCPAAVQSLAHVSAVTEYFKLKPSENKRRIKNVAEQRITGFVTYILLALFSYFGHYCAIPSATIFGVFAYLGVRNLDGNHCLKRINMIFTSNKYREKFAAWQNIPIITIQGFTAFQCTLLVIMLMFKSTEIGGICFPLFLIGLVFLRIYVLPLMFNTEVVELLDRELPSTNDEEDADDFFGDSRIPV